MMMGRNIAGCFFVLIFISAVFGEKNEFQFVHPAHHFEVTLPAGWDATDTAEGLELVKGDSTISLDVMDSPVKNPGEYLSQLASPSKGMNIEKIDGPKDVSTPLPGAEISVVAQSGNKKIHSRAILLNDKTRAFILYGDWPEGDADADKVFTALLKDFKPNSEKTPTPLPLKVNLTPSTSDEMKLRMAAPLEWPGTQIDAGHVFWTLPTPACRIDLMLAETSDSPDKVADNWETQMTGADSPLKKRTAKSQISLGDKKCLQVDFTGDALIGRLLVIKLLPEKSVAISLICPKGVLPRYENILQQMAASLQPVLDVKTPELGAAVASQPLPANATSLTHKSGKFTISLPAEFEVTQHTDEELLLSTKTGPSFFRFIYLGFGGSKRNIQPKLESFCEVFKKDNPAVTFGLPEPYSTADGTWTGLTVTGQGKFDGASGKVRFYMVRNLLGQFVCIYQAAHDEWWPKLNAPFSQIVGSMTATKKGEK